MKKLCLIAELVVLVLWILGCGTAPPDSSDALRVEHQEEADAYLWPEDIEGEKALNWVEAKKLSQNC